MKSCYFGLSDINNKKIYSNISIVEFIAEVEGKQYELHGIFRYDSKLCCYILECIDFDRIFIYAISFNNIKNIKIVDKTYKNKLGLI
jgi:hypothetical protein